MNDADIVKELEYCTISAADLIKRQQEEIENRKKKAKGYQTLWCEAEIDIRTARSAAIKEFAERLKAELTTGVGVMRVPTIAVIDNLVKEMTEAG